MRNLNLKNFVKKISENKITIFIITLIFIILGAIYSYNFIEPEYKSNSKIIIRELTPSDEWIETYNQIIKSKTSIKKVITEANINGNIEEISKNVSIKRNGKSDVLELSVINKNSKFSRDINKGLTSLLSEKLSEIYNVKKFYIIDEAVVEENPCNINHGLDILNFAILGFLVSIVFVIICNYIKNKFKEKLNIKELLKTKFSLLNKKQDEEIQKEPENEILEVDDKKISISEKDKTDTEELKEEEKKSDSVEE